MLASRTALRMIVVTPATSRMESCRGSNAMLVLLVPSRATSIDLDHARKVQLMDTLAVSELPDTSMTCATLRALLDILSINMTRGEAKALIANSLNAFGE